MVHHSARSAIFVSALTGLLGLTLSGGAQAQSVRSQCSAKYQAAKTAGTLQGQSWNKFYSQCAAEAKAGAGAVPAAETAPAEPVAPAAAAPAPATPRASRTATAPAAPTVAPAAGDAVFPSAISPQYSTLSAGRARMKTCADQYNANKASGGNGALKWIQKGGGYWSECNKHLKS